MVNGKDLGRNGTLFFGISGVSDGLNQTDWDLIISRIKEMQLPLVRMWVQLYFATSDPDNNVWNWDNRRMQSIFKHLDFACRNNIEVAITDWGWSFWYLHSGKPTDPKYAQGLARFLKELLIHRGYSCIKYFIELNEPDYEGYFSDISGYFADYVTMITNIDNALKNEGIRDRIKLLGPDEGCCGSYFVPTIQSPLHSIFDGYDFHIYQAPSEIANGNLWWRIEQYRDYVKNYSPNSAIDLPKPQFISEAGTTDGVSDNFSHALNMADYGTTSLSTRVQGVIAWNLYDQYYDQSSVNSTSEGVANYQMIPWGLWKYKSSSWQLRPYAQTWGLLTRFAPRGSLKVAINGSPPATYRGGSLLRVGAVKRPDNGWSIFLVNRNASASEIQINLPDSISHQFDRYQVDGSTFGKYPNKIIIPPIGTLSASTTIIITLPASSFTVLAETSNLISDPTPTPINPPIITPSPTPTFTCVGTVNNYCPPIGEWKFEEGSGNIVADSSNYGNDAVVYGTGISWSPSGKQGKAISFNGQRGNYIHVKNPIMPSKAYTKTAWVYLNSGSQNNSIMGSGLGGVNHEFAVIRGGYGGNCNGVNGRLAAGHNGNYCSVVDSSSFPTASWIHVAVTYDADVGGGTLKLYKNGILVGSATNIAPIIDDPFVNIGAWNYGSVWDSQADYRSVWNGLLDQVRLYNYALTSSQIVYDMNTTDIVYPSPVSSPTPGCPAGDLTNDCYVDISDIFIFLPDYGKSSGMLTFFYPADFNKDTVVNSVDYAVILSNFKK